MRDVQAKQAVVDALKEFSSMSVAEAAVSLLGSLGYRSDRRIPLDSNAPESFLAMFGTGRPLNRDQALLDEWKAVDLLFQLTDEDVRSAAGGGQLGLFESKGNWDGAVMESYLFAAISLRNLSYTRTQLAGITRAVNRLFPMPVMILFRHGTTATLSIINRRLHKRDGSKDVLEKVTLIKDIRITNPHRAHIEILFDLSFDELYRKHRFTNFPELHSAWQKTLDTSELNKKFFQEIANWYFWALSQVTFPRPTDIQEIDSYQAQSVIRLITRLIFCWFLREKGLISDQLFDEKRARQLLGSLDPDETTFYKAILQNLFFATLNQEMDKRKFRNDGQNFMAHNLYRYKHLLTDPDGLLELLASIPFMNGGLFECLDKVLGTKDKPVYVRIDGFSDRDDNPLLIPNDLFFGHEREVDLSKAYGEKRYRNTKVRGLIHTLNRYKFTIAENTPIEEEIALDPELLGKVFENLLAAYNPETGATARKQTGSFYTPREIVDYMVDESLIAYLKTKLEDSGTAQPDVEERLRHLFAYNEEPHRLGADEVSAVIKALDDAKVLDPACGSGAFPIGVLHKMVFILSKLDPHNERWKAKQIQKAMEFPDVTIREKAIEDIEEAFSDNELDYGRKLYLIENCIYGVDIQPIAVQISKLRFFISLIADQKENRDTPNLGIRPLPNLETRFVAANTLIPAGRPDQQLLPSHEIAEKEEELRKVRERHFMARTPSTKARCREEDARLREEISQLLELDGWDHKTAGELASWNPYDQNASAGFFDPEWMFGVLTGFHITIGNPPYVRADGTNEHMALRKAILESGRYRTLWEKWDLYVAFIELGYSLLQPGGITTMIVSDAYCHSKYAEKSQKWFLQNSRILKLDFLSKIKVFDAAVRNIVYLFQKADGACNKPERRLHDVSFGNVTVLPTDEQRNLTYRAFFPEDNEHRALDVPSLPLESVCYISKGMVVHADEKVAKGAFELRDLVSDTMDELHSKAFVEGKHLDRWLPTTHQWLEWGTERAPALFSRPTFPELYAVSEKLISVDMAAGVERLRVAYDANQLLHNHSAWSFVPWHYLQGVRNNSLKKAARYPEEKPPRPDLPNREQLEDTSRRFSTKYLLAVMNSSFAKDFLRANRRSNIHLYPDDWKELPVPDVSQEVQATVVLLVNRMLEAKTAGDKEKMVQLETEIDDLVYELYGLKPDEATTVVQSTPPE